MAMTRRLAPFGTAAWLGWLIDSNWTDPWMFAVYALARPLATGLILVGMYWAVRGPAVHAALFTSFFVANAFHTYVNAVVVDMGWIVFGEREEYETLKYVVTSPLGLLTYLSGRAVVKFARATLSVAVMLLMGWYLLGIRWDWALARPAPLAISLVLGLVAVLFVGYLVAGAALVLTRGAITVLEGVTLGLYLLCGVIFPIDLLPRVLQGIAMALPFTWWYEAIRRFLLGHGSSHLLGGLGDGQLIAALATATALASLGSLWGFRALERHARRTGCLDQTTLY